MNDLIAAALRGIDIAVENLAMVKAAAEKLDYRREYIAYFTNCLADANELRERLAQLMGE